MNITVDRPSVFRSIIRFMNRNFETIKAKVTLTPEDPAEEVQQISVNFPSTGR